MKKTVLTFGLMSGAILAVMMLATLPFMDRIGFEKGEVIGYTTIVAAFLLVFFGIRSYRDNSAGGTLSFGRGVLVGVLISLVASACYVAAWEVIYYELAPDFGEKYGAYMIEKERAAGASAQQLAETAAQAERFQAIFRNPLLNAAFAFIEPFPIGLIVSLVSAGILRRRRPDKSVQAAGAMAVTLG
jgi:hypothetical protein